MQRLTIALIAVASLWIVGCTSPRSATTQFKPRWSFYRSMTTSSQLEERERAKGRIPPGRTYSVPAAAPRG